jgi:hypothetical protein
MRGFHCDNFIHAYSVPWTSSPYHCIPIPSLPLPSSFKQCLVGFLSGIYYAKNYIYIDTYIHMHMHIYICSILPFSHSLHPLVSFPFPLLAPTNSSLVPHIHLFYIIIIITILVLSSTNKWQHVIFGLFSFYLAQHNNIQLHSFFCKCCNLIFLYAWVIFQGMYVCRYIT